MVEIKQTSKGHKFIEVTSSDMIMKLNGYAICDSCSSGMFNKGYLIPVLNSVYCEACFSDFSSKAEYYEEDRSYENMKTEEFKRVLS